MDDKAAVLADVCAALSGNQLEEAGAILRKRYPFVPLINVRRRYSVRQMLTGFVRDGFIDRYCGARLVCVAALRLISKRLPDQFPFQTNWRTDACHFAFWELVPTLDQFCQCRAAAPMTRAIGPPRRCSAIRRRLTLHSMTWVGRFVHPAT
jgi:hypothetical protein